MPTTLTPSPLWLRYAEVGAAGLYLSDAGRAPARHRAHTPGRHRYQVGGFVTRRAALQDCDVCGAPLALLLTASALVLAYYQGDSLHEAERCFRLAEEAMRDANRDLAARIHLLIPAHPEAHGRNN